MPRILTVGNGLTLVLLMLAISVSAQAEQTSLQRLDITESMLPVPTHCLASGRACIATRSLDTGLSVNPANLIVDDKPENLWNIDVGNINDQLNHLTDQGRINRRQFQFGFAHGTKYWGLGLALNLSRAEHSIESGLDGFQTLRSESTLDSAGGSIKFSILVADAHSIGVSLNSGLISHDIKQAFVDGSVARNDKLYRGSYAQIGYYFALSPSIALAATYRPETTFHQQSPSSATFNQANTDKPSALLQAERIGLGAHWAAGRKKWLNMEANIVASKTPSDSAPLEQLIQPFAQDSSSISTTNNSSSTWLFHPGAGMKLSLPSWLFFDMIATGAYWEPYDGNGAPPKFHRTWGIGRAYSLFGMDLSVQFAVDQAGEIRNYQINLL